MADWVQITSCTIATHGSLLYLTSDTASLPVIRLCVSLYAVWMPVVPDTAVNNLCASLIPTLLDVLCS